MCHFAGGGRARVRPAPGRAAAAAPARAGAAPVLAAAARPATRPRAPAGQAAAAPPAGAAAARPWCSRLPSSPRRSSPRPSPRIEEPPGDEPEAEVEAPPAPAGDDRRQRRRHPRAAGGGPAALGARAGGAGVPARRPLRPHRGAGRPAGGGGDGRAGGAGRARWSSARCPSSTPPPSPPSASGVFPQRSAIRDGRCGWSSRSRFSSRCGDPCSKQSRTQAIHESHRLRTVLFWIHLGTGLGAGLVVAVMGATGADHGLRAADPRVGRSGHPAASRCPTRRRPAAPSTSCSRACSGRRPGRRRWR